MIDGIQFRFKVIPLDMILTFNLIARALKLLLHDICVFNMESENSLTAASARSIVISQVPIPNLYLTSDVVTAILV